MSMVKLFGDRPVHRVLDFFRVYCFWDYSLKDIAKEAKVSHRTLQYIIPRLEKLGMVVYTRTEGKAKLYKFDTKNPLAMQIQDMAITSDIIHAIKHHRDAKEVIEEFYEISAEQHAKDRPEIMESLKHRAIPAR